jgi:hypothetical protein
LTYPYTDDGDRAWHLNWWRWHLSNVCARLSDWAKPR